MPFSLFTKPAAEPSRRLRYLARCFRGYAAAQIARAALEIVLVPMFGTLHFWSQKAVVGLLATSTMISTVQALSLFLISQALLRRQKWAGYAGVFVLTAPLVVKSAPGMPMELRVIGVGLTVLSVAALASVWKELDSSGRGLEFDELDEDVREVPTRIRGYGEPKILPAEKILVPTIAAAKTQIPVEIRRND